MKSVNFNIVLIENEDHYNEWVKMDKYENWYIVYHYADNVVQRKCMYDDFFEAIECLNEWQSYFE